MNDKPEPELAPQPDLAAAIRQARVENAERAEAIADLREIEMGRLALLEQWVRAQLRNSARDQAVIRACRVLAEQPYTDVADVAVGLGWSVRKAHREFVAACGYGPKTMQRILRVQHVIRTVHRARQPLRLIEVATGKTDRHGQPEVLLLATDRLDLDASLIALGYKYRWLIELFFRWLKCILGCRHLLSHCQNGVQIQVYLALIASLLISLWTGRKPSKRTFEMLCFYFSGWASADEVLTHLQKLAEKDTTDKHK